LWFNSSVSWCTGWEEKLIHFLMIWQNLLVLSARIFQLPCFKMELPFFFSSSLSHLPKWNCCSFFFHRHSLHLPDSHSRSLSVSRNHYATLYKKKHMQFVFMLFPTIPLSLLFSFFLKKFLLICFIQVFISGQRLSGTGVLLRCWLAMCILRCLCWLKGVVIERSDNCGNSGYEEGYVDRFWRLHWDGKVLSGGI